MSKLLKTLLQRSDYLAVEYGKIILIPKNKDTQTSDRWLKDNWLKVASEILITSNQTGFAYQEYTTGRYTQHKAGSLHLTLYNPVTGNTAYAIFNAKLTRGRNTRFGDENKPLPKKRFTVKEHSGFTKFWRDMNIPLPRRLSAFHDCMGKLKHRLISAKLDENGKAINKTLKPFSITHEELISLVTEADITQTSTKQTPNNYQTRAPDKERAQTHCLSAIETISGTCLNHCEVKVKETTNKVSATIHPLNGHKAPEDQTLEEWDMDYDNAATAHREI
ncbi:hypothetical protein [Amphritea sp.]|uniref:hypothetical protein n=1 Tax=Amphritea sp. TaxID=1872502 RepID=UPI0025BCC743|nr:hypothetical protein [Amphritea sp.]